MNHAVVDEAEWTASPDLQTVPYVRLDEFVGTSRRIVVVSPHPDDETLSCGGTLADLAASGVSVHVISVTDGEASHAGSRLWSPSTLAVQRRNELSTAIGELGLPSGSITSLGLPDGGLRRFRKAMFRSLLETIGSQDLVLCPWRADGHPDHEEVAAAALAVHAVVGCRIVEAPIWAWHWQHPDAAGIPWTRSMRVRLSEAAVVRKARALGCFASQRTSDPHVSDTPIIGPAMLAHFTRPFEVFIRHAA